MSLLFYFDEQASLAKNILKDYPVTKGEWEFRRFPDGESYIRLLSNVKNTDTTILCSLHQPDDKILPLLFLSETLREFGAKNVGLIAPYLCYMRQDKRFNEGECITSRPFAKLISQHFDWLSTIDPHLHRYHDLSEIYSIPTTTHRAALAIVDWIKQHVAQPLIIGPDEESRQWAQDMAQRIGCPFTVLTKIRHGDRQVEVSIPDVEQYREMQPVLVDDIISTAHTMIETTKHLHHLGLKAPVCIGIHAVFSQNAYKELIASGVKEIVTCNTIPHLTNKIDISHLCKK